MKKVLCVLLAAILTFGCAATAFAAKVCDCPVSPVIYIRGFGEELYLNPESEDRTEALSLSLDAVLAGAPDLLYGVVAKAAAGDYDPLLLAVEKIADGIIGNIVCDQNGDSKYDVGVKPRELPTEDNHQYTSYSGAVEYDGMPDAEYDFHYDWRLDPMDNARLLKDFADHIRELTGHKKVSFIAHSQGNTLVAAYLALFGSDEIDKIIFLSPAFEGLSIMGSLFAGEAVIDDKGDALVGFVDSVLGKDEFYSDFVSMVVKFLNDKGFVGTVLDDAQLILDKEFKKVYAEYLRDTLVTMPGFWSFVPDEYFDRAIEFTFGGTEGYEKLIARIEDYHYNVQVKLCDLLDEAKANGVNFVIGCGYGISSIPLSDSPVQHSDMTIDTKYMSIGATCAPFGETFADDYVQAVDDGHNHISPDRMIDASTCAYPEYTFFIKGQLHPDFCDGYREWIQWALLYDGQPTVTSDPAFPQFTEMDGEETKPVEEPEQKVEKRGLWIFLEFLFELLSKLFFSIV